jgi:hypothetical protein
LLASPGVWKSCDLSVIIYGILFVIIKVGKALKPHCYKNANSVQIKSVVGYNHMMEFLRVLDASIGVQGRNVLYADNCNAQRKIYYSTARKICTLFIKLHKIDAFHEDWIWLDAEEDVDSFLTRMTTFPLPYCGIFRQCPRYATVQGVWK